MSFSRCLAVPSVAASGGFSSLSVYLVQMLFRNDVECRTSGSSACTYLHLGVRTSPHPPSERGTNPRRKSGVTALTRNSCTAEIADQVVPSGGSGRFEVKHRSGGLRSGGTKRATESWRGRHGW